MAQNGKLERLIGKDRGANRAGRPREALLLSHSKTGSHEAIAEVGTSIAAIVPRHALRTE